MVGEDVRRRAVLLVLLWHVYIISPSLVILRWSTAQDRWCLPPKKWKSWV